MGVIKETIPKILGKVKGRASMITHGANKATNIHIKIVRRARVKILGTILDLRVGRVRKEVEGGEKEMMDGEKDIVDGEKDMADGGKAMAKVVRREMGTRKEARKAKVKVERCLPAEKEMQHRNTRLLRRYVISIANICMKVEIHAQFHLVQVGTKRAMQPFDDVFATAKIDKQNQRANNLSGG